MKIKIVSEILKKSTKFVGYATPGSCAIYLRACIEEPLEIYPGEVRMIPSGIALDMSAENFDEDGVSFHMGAMILPRLGLGAKHGIVLGNLVGLIGSDCQGEIMVALWNRNQVVASQNYRPEPFIVNPLDRIAQMAFVPFVKPRIEFVSAFDSATERGSNGFGSSGVL